MEPMLGLMRRWGVQWLGGGDPMVPDAIMAPGYRVSIGGFVLEGRDAYVAGTLDGLVNRYPGVGLTVHELICNGDSVALRFTEHGADPRRDDTPVAWGGVALHHSDGGLLTHSFAEEDYLSRRRQVAAGACDPIEPPAPAPWNTAAQAPDEEAERTVRGWLAHGDLAGADLDDDWLGHDAPPLLHDATIDVDDLFSAGRSVAFHGVQRGRYAGGLEGLAPTDYEERSLPLAGLVTVGDDGSVRGRVVRDRLGLHRALSKAAA